MNMTNLESLYEAILKGKHKDAVTLTNAALEENASPKDIIDNYMIKAMEEIGRKFERQEAFVPELLLAGRAMKASLNILQPLLKSSDSSSAFAGKIVIGTVKGDLHDIGKNLVASMFEGCGFEVIDLGIDVDSGKFIQAIREYNADILGMSAMLTTTMVYMKTVIEALTEAGLRENVKVMVGGAPINSKFAQEIGADNYSDNANSAVNNAKQWIK